MSPSRSTSDPVRVRPNLRDRRDGFRRRSAVRLPGHHPRLAPSSSGRPKQRATNASRRRSRSMATQNSARCRARRAASCGGKSRWATSSAPATFRRLHSWGDRDGTSRPVPPIAWPYHNVGPHPPPGHVLIPSRRNHRSRRMGGHGGGGRSCSRKQDVHRRHGPAGASVHNRRAPPPLGPRRPAPHGRPHPPESAPTLCPVPLTPVPPRPVGLRAAPGRAPRLGTRRRGCASDRPGADHS